MSDIFGSTQNFDIYYKKKVDLFEICNFLIFHYNLYDYNFHHTYYHKRKMLKISLLTISIIKIFIDDPPSLMAFLRFFIFLIRVKIFFFVTHFFLDVACSKKLLHSHKYFLDRQQIFDSLINLLKLIFYLYLRFKIF